MDLLTHLFSASAFLRTGKADAFYLLCQSEVSVIQIQCCRGGESDQYWSVSEPLLVEILSYIGAHRAPIRGVSLSCDGAGSPLALVEISQRREVDDSKYGKFVFLFGSIPSPMLGEKCLLPRGEAASVGALLCLPLECRALSLDCLARNHGKRRHQAE